MKNQLNPFQNLYVTERLSAKEYVHIFCPLLVSQALPLFQTGNVVLQGTQGSGKTTLLALLTPSIREAYHEQKIDFPIPEKASKFISAGINITKSGILDFGRRPINKKNENDFYPLYFSDFFNYHIVLDIFDHILNAQKYKHSIASIQSSEKKIDNFAREISKSDCFFEFFHDCKTMMEIYNKSKLRIQQYRLFHQFNIENLPREVVSSKTNIGEPISRIARLLKESEIISDETEVFIRIDQLEVLLDCDEVREELGQQYRRMINSALSTRDRNVSYKIGIRTFAWGKELRIFRAENSIEAQRDYTVIDFDTILRRPENPRSWIFPKFAKNVFRRRLEFCNIRFNCNFSDDDLFKNVFGITLRNKELAKRYCSKTNHDKAIKIPSKFPYDLKNDIKKFHQEDPFFAILVKSWYQQNEKLLSDYITGHISVNNAPWGEYWQKERKHIALLQLAANCSQAPIWGGVTDIINLSCAGILGFLSICQNIWDIYLRTAEPKQIDEIDLECPTKIDINLQTIGIKSASEQWYKKIIELPDGNDSQRFITLLGVSFRNALLSDLKMSNPGQNGFSLLNSEFTENSFVKKTLSEATDHGILISAPHTSKNKKDGLRTKWYLNPIYCPYFKIFAAHTKEPYYAKTSEVATWIKAAHLDKKIQFFSKINEELTLFPVGD